MLNRQSELDLGLLTGSEHMCEETEEDTKQILSKRKQFRAWLHSLKEHSPSMDINDEETVFVDAEDAFLNSDNPLSYVPVLSATEAKEILTTPEREAKDYPHGRRLKAFLREHLRRPSKRRLLTARPRRPIECHGALPVVFDINYQESALLGSNYSNKQQWELGELDGSVGSEAVSVLNENRQTDHKIGYLGRYSSKMDLNNEGKAFTSLAFGTNNPVDPEPGTQGAKFNKLSSSDADIAADDKLAEAAHQNDGSFLSGDVTFPEPRDTLNDDSLIMRPDNGSETGSVERENAKAFGTLPIEPDSVADPGSPKFLDDSILSDDRQDSLKRTFDSPNQLITELKRPCLDKEAVPPENIGVEANESLHESSSFYSDAPPFDTSFCETPTTMLENNPHMIQNPYINTHQADEKPFRDFQNPEPPQALSAKDAREPANYKDLPPIKTPSFIPISKLNRLNSSDDEGPTPEEKFRGVVEKFRSAVHHQTSPKCDAQDQTLVGRTGKKESKEDRHSDDDLASRKGHSSKGSNSSGGRLSSLKKKRQTFKPSKCEEFETQKLRIPTFRQSLRKIDALGLFEGVRKGTLTERDLFNLSKVKSDDAYDFRDTRFYDSQSSVSNSSESFKTREEITVSSVKFDKFSHLLMYDVRKTSRFERPETTQSFRTNNLFGKEGKLSRSLSDSGTQDGGKIKSFAGKPILKRKINERAAVESLRADDCDTVNVTDFLSFFKGHEARRRNEEHRLSKIREQQLTNYYANDHIYNSVRNGDVKSALIDFKKSKKATEHNIGRQLRDPIARMLSCPRESEWQRLHKQGTVSQSCF
ncbi:LAFA_0F05028g1_1 [Lachancea sp. 'fantastica']|nr:LAFA_0F05028g1_1 [Lachancea sp. 'fantastica']